MNRREFLKDLPSVAALAIAASSLADETAPKPAGGESGKAPVAPQAAPTAPAVNLEAIVLPKPQTDGGKSVLAALWERKTNRNVSDKKLPPQILSDLLWAAFGVNREKGPKNGPGRTAASASNSQETSIYVAMAEGVYLYEAIGHRLTPVVQGDLRAKAGKRASGANAPVRLIYVADLAKYAKAGMQEPGLKDDDIQKSYYFVGTGLIAGNVYLYAASQGLAAWFHNCDKPGLTKALGLSADQRVTFAQTVGYPAS